MTATPDYSIGFTREEVEEILAAQQAELKRTLAAWSESGSSVQKRRIDEIHAIIAAGTGELGSATCLDWMASGGFGL